MLAKLESSLGPAFDWAPGKAMNVYADAAVAALGCHARTPGGTIT